MIFEETEIDYAIFEPTSNKKILKGNGELVDQLAYIAKKMNVEDEVVKELKREGAWY